MKTLAKPAPLKNRMTLLRDERGLSTVEYVIILVLIAAAAIGSWVTLGGKIRDKIGATNEKMDEVKVESQPGQ